MQKGFTLVELLAILVVLGIITVIAVPNVIKTNQDSVNKDYAEFEKTVENAAEIYLETHIDEKPSSGESKDIKVDTLIKQGLLNENMTNPKSLEVINKDSYVHVQRKENGGNITYEYEYKEDN